VPSPCVSNDGVGSGDGINKPYFNVTPIGTPGSAFGRPARGTFGNSSAAFNHVNLPPPDAQVGVSGNDNPRARVHQRRGRELGSASASSSSGRVRSRCELTDAPEHLGATVHVVHGRRAAASRDLEAGVNRITMMSELAASLSHELRQPSGYVRSPIARHGTVGAYRSRKVSARRKCPGSLLS
jgi:signal transduction histidine kinase